MPTRIIRIIRITCITRITRSRQPAQRLSGNAQGCALLDGVHLLGDGCRGTNPAIIPRDKVDSLSNLRRAQFLDRILRALQAPNQGYQQRSDVAREEIKFT